MGARPLRVLMVAGFLTLVFAMQAFAAERYLCDVRKAGTIGVTAVEFVLTDTAAVPLFTDRRFRARNDRTREMLAIGLAAMQTGMRVEIIATVNPTGVPAIIAMSLAP